jgi:hypothetical protein
MGNGKNTGNSWAEEILKANEALKLQRLKLEQMEQLTYLNKELMEKLKATEKNHRSLMKYIQQMHKNLGDNFNRTPVEEIWHRELDRFIKRMVKK